MTRTSMNKIVKLKLNSYASHTVGLCVQNSIIQPIKINNLTIDTI